MTGSPRDLVDRIADTISSGTARAGDVTEALDGDTPFEVALVPDSTVVWHVTIPIDGTLRIEDLEDRYGPASRLPPTLNFPSPRYRMSDPSRRVTLIAEVGSGGVSKVTVQADDVDLSAGKP